MLRKTIKGRFRAGKDVSHGSENTNRRYLKRIGRNGFCGLSGCRHIPANSGRFSRFAAIILRDRKQTAETVRERVISNWMAVFGAPEIIFVDNDTGFIGGIPQEFRPARNIVSQTLIPRHHQSLGETARRRGHSRTIIDRVIGNKKPNSSGRK